MTLVLNRTLLHPAHLSAQGRMVAFGGYDMPVQYAGERGGVLAEHRWTRENAGLFDVSHMGPAWLRLVSPSGDADTDHAAVAAIVESRVCGDILGLKPGQLRYTLLMNDAGGIVDDLIIGRPAEAARQGSLYVVVNAGTKAADFALLAEAAAGRAHLEPLDDGGLLALQGPAAAAVAETVFPGAADLSFMSFRRFETAEGAYLVARAGYTGEDGFEIWAPPERALALWERLLRDERVAPVGLGARDSLRLEAGLPLYGHDIDASTSPVEAGLTFAIGKRRRAARDFQGATRVMHELQVGPSRIRVGLRLAPGAAPAREGAEVLNGAGQPVGLVTSGGPSPSLGGAIAMAYVEPAFVTPGTSLSIRVRGRTQAAHVVSLPFHPHRYVRKPAAA